MVSYSNPNNFNWEDYYDRIAKNPARETVLKAIEIFSKENHNQQLLALDLGCGSGRDTIVLLAKNWYVLAVDREQKAIDLVTKKVQGEAKERLSTAVSCFEELKFTNEFDLINASYSLPFCPDRYFPKLWSKIIKAIKIGGRFSGQLFGQNDSWTEYDDMNFHSKEEIFELFKKFEINYFLEEEKDAPSTSGKVKHWHIFHIIAQKLE